MKSHYAPSGAAAVCTTLAALTLIAPSPSDAGLVWQSSLDGSAEANIGADAIPFGFPVPTADLNGNAEGAILVNSAGEGDYFIIEPFIPVFDQASVSVWIRPDVVDGTEDGIFGIGASGGGTAQYFSAMNQADMLFRVDLDDGVTRRDILSDFAPITGEWIHLVVTFNSTADGSLELRMYIDGALQGDVQTIPAGTYMMTNDWIFGTERTTERFFTGALDDFRLYDNELDPVAVEELYDAGPLFGILDDSDMDGLPDRWELSNMLDPDVATGDDGAAGDPDMDGVPNIDEFDNSTNPQKPDTDDDGLDDNVETNTGVFVDATDTGTDPLNPDTDGDGLLDGAETNTGTFVSVDDTGSDPLTPFSDADPNPDGWEVMFELDPNDPADGTTDPDVDGLGNDAEFVAGTDPRNPDSDGDTVTDGVELLTNNTDPLDPDSDGDGLSDAVETNTGTFLSESDTGTDPNFEDTDGDGIGDFAEIVLGSNPNVTASLPAFVPRVLFIGGQAGATQGADGAIVALLRQRYGEFSVDYLQASASSAGSVEGYDMLVLSSTPGSGDLRGKFQDASIPVVNWEEAIADEDSGELQLTSMMTKPLDVTQAEIINPDHPITQGFGDAPFTIFDAEVEVSASPLDSLAPGVVPLALTGGDAGLFVAEAGAALLGIGGIDSPEVAPARRVHLPLTDVTFNSANADGRALIGRAFDWAVGVLSDTPATFRIISFDLDTLTDTATIRFTSTPSEDYFLEASPSLEPFTWIGVPGTFVAGQEDVTQVTVEGAMENYPPPHFFRVRIDD